MATTEQKVKKTPEKKQDTKKEVEKPIVKNKKKFIDLSIKELLDIEDACRKVCAIYEQIINIEHPRMSDSEDIMKFRKLVDLDKALLKAIENKLNIIAEEYE